MSLSKMGFGMIICGSNTIFRKSNELKRVCLLIVKLEHPILSFKRTETSNRTFTRFTKSLIEQYQTSFFRNIEHTQTCSSFANRTRTPYFCLWTIELRILDLVQSITESFLKKHLLFKSNLYSKVAKFGRVVKADVNLKASTEEQQ